MIGWINKSLGLQCVYRKQKRVLGSSDYFGDYLCCVSISSYDT